MKRIYTQLVLVALVLIFSSGCKKYKTVIEEDDVLNPEDLISINDMNIPVTFDWSLQGDYIFSISSSRENVIEITSIDGEIIYHKGSYIPVDGTYDVELRIPSYVESVLVNDMPVALTGNIINIDLSTKDDPYVNWTLDFDGSDSLVVSGATGTGLDFTAASNWTVSMWIKPANVTNAQYLFEKKHYNDNASFAILLAGAELVVRLDNNESFVKLETGYDVIAGECYHIAATKQNDSISFFVDGVFIDGMKVSANIIAGSTKNEENIYIGNNNNGSFPYIGVIDEVRVWNWARTASQISAQLYSTFPSSTGLMLYFKLDEGSGTIAIDETSNSNDGTHADPTYVLNDCNEWDCDNDGVIDDEDDFPCDPERAYKNYYPAAGYGSLVYEDLWPGKGDYDFNDVVVDYQFMWITNADNKMVEILSTFVAKASGAGLFNGFGFNFPEANSFYQNKPSHLTVSGSNIQETYISLNGYGTENGQTYPTIIVFDDIFNLLPHPGTPPGVTGVNTTEWAPFVPYDSVFIYLKPSALKGQNKLKIKKWNPFIIVGGDRSHEVHLMDYPPTDLADMGLFGTIDDASSPGTGETYKDVKNLPWALELPTTFKWPRERIEIHWAYLKFQAWAESGGTEYKDWYMDNPGYINKIHDNLYDPPSPLK